MKSKSIIVEILCALIIVMFLYAAVSKLLYVQKFWYAMMTQPLPLWIKWATVIILPPSEIIISIFLMTNKFRMLGLKLFVVEMIAFTIYIGLILGNQFEKIPCTCGGIIQGFKWKEHLAFNIVYIIIGIAAIKLWKDVKNSPHPEIASDHLHQH